MGSRRIVLSTPWFNVEKETYDGFPAMRGQAYYRMNCPDGVTVLPITRDKKIVLVRQFRWALNQRTLEFPAGGIDAGESAEKAAARELYEETGYVCERLASIGSGRSIMSRVNHKIHLFFGKNAERREDFAPKEDIEVVLVSFEEFREMVLSGQFENLAALGMLMLLRWKLGVVEWEGLWT